MILLYFLLVCSQNTPVEHNVHRDLYKVITFSNFLHHICACVHVEVMTLVKTLPFSYMCKPERKNADFLYLDDTVTIYNHKVKSLIMRF